MFDTEIPLYGIFILLSITIGLLFIYINAKRKAIKDEEIIGLLVYITLGAIFGAKYFTLITNFKKYSKTFEFSKVSLSSYGAAIGVLLMLFLFSKQFNKNKKELISITLPTLPLMYSISKIGCFLSGCCYGIEYKGYFSVVYKYSFNAPNGISLFPIQLLEAIVFIIIFFYCNMKTKENISDKTIGYTLISCGISKCLLDFLRMSHNGKIISINQIVSILAILVGILILFKNQNIKKPRQY